MEIKVVGPGCKNCKNLLATVEQAVKDTNLSADVIYVTEMADIVATGIMRTPGLIVDGQIKIMGRVPSLKEVTKILTAV